MVNNLQRLTRFSKKTSSDKANYEISIPNINQESVTTNFDFQVNSLDKNSLTVIP